MEAKWTKVKESATDAGVMAEDFAEAAITIISVFDLITGMGVAKNDMLGNANTLKGLSAGSGKTLQQLVDAEIEGKDAKGIKKLAESGKTAGSALSSEHSELSAARAVALCMPSSLSPLMWPICAGGSPSGRPTACAPTAAGYHPGRVSW